jgi:RND family efflux transporter MFP subunit
MNSTKHRFTRTCPGLVAALVLAAGGLCLTGCGRKPQEPAGAGHELPAVAVRVQAVQAGQQAAFEEVVGTIRAKLRATLEAKVTGRVETLPVVLGQRVKSGQLIARLDAAEIKARLAQAQAGLQQAEREWKRASALLEQQALTRSEFDAADARYGVAKAAVAEAEAMTKYLEVSAPFDGVVTKKWADEGDLAVPGKPLVDIEDPTALQVEADIPEAIAARVQRDARLEVRVAALTNALTGTVSELAPAADPIARTLRVKLDLPATPALMSGQFARLQVPLGETRSLRVPAAAVVQRGQMEIAFVAVNQRAALHLVKTGRRLGDLVEILAGLEPDDAVVVEGAAQLVDGQPLTTK